MRPATAVVPLALLLSPAYNWLFIVKLGWGLDGAALAMDALQVGVFLGCVAFVLFISCLSICGAWL